MRLTKAVLTITLAATAVCSPGFASILNVTDLGYNPQVFFPDPFGPFFNFNNGSFVVTTVLNVSDTYQSPNGPVQHQGSHQQGAGPFSDSVSNYDPNNIGILTGSISSASGAVDEANGVLRAAGSAGSGAPSGVNPTWAGSGSATAEFSDMLSLSDEDTITISGSLDGKMGNAGSGNAGVSLFIGFYDPLSLDLAGDVDPHWVATQWDAITVDGALPSASCSVENPCNSPGGFDVVPVSTSFSIDVDLPQGTTFVMFQFSANAGAQLGGQGFGISDFANTLHFQLTLPDDGTIATSQTGLLPINVDSANAVPEPGTWALMLLGIVALAAIGRAADSPTKPQTTSATPETPR